MNMIHHFNIIRYTMKNFHAHVNKGLKKTSEYEICDSFLQILKCGWNRAWMESWPICRHTHLILILRVLHLYCRFFWDIWSFAHLLGTNRTAHVLSKRSHHQQHHESIQGFIQGEKRGEAGRGRRYSQRRLSSPPHSKHPHSCHLSSYFVTWAQLR